MKELSSNNKAYEEPSRSLKEHEKRMEALILEYSDSGQNNIIDLGCADGRFLEHISGVLSCNSVCGIDNDAVLLEKAREKKYDAEKKDFILGDVNQVSLPEQLFDIVIASGIFCFTNDLPALCKKLHNQLTDNGKLFFFGQIISNPVDIRLGLKLTEEESWERELNILSVKSLTGILESYFRIKVSEPFTIPFDLPRKNDVFSTYTVTTSDDNRLVISNYNLLTEHQFIVAEKVSL